MIVCKMKHKKKHNNIAYEFFHYSQTIAILPLKEKLSSVVITSPENDSRNLLKMNKMGVRFSNENVRIIEFRKFRIFRDT